MVASISLDSLQFELFVILVWAYWQAGVLHACAVAIRAWRS